MPTYDYECKECHHEWCEDQAMSDAAVTVCPKCSQEKAKRLISGSTSFILNGSGWAKDGYGR